MLSDRDARGIVAGIMPGAPLATLQILQAVGRFESGYGAGFKNNANNWGAVQSHKPPCGEGSFEHGDTHADGTPYVTCFKSYDTPEAGARDMIQEIMRRPGVPALLATGDATAVATAMRAGGYFEAPVEKYATAIVNNAKAIAASIGEPLVVRIGGRVEVASAAASSLSMAPNLAAVMGLGSGFLVIRSILRRRAL
jgi:hypothetical protein